MNFVRDVGLKMRKNDQISEMSQKTKSIADALKSSPTRRQAPAVENSALNESEGVSKFDDIHSSDSNSLEEHSEDVVSESLPNPREETTSSEDLIARLSRLQAKDDSEEPEEQHHEDQPHRATSRQRQQRTGQEKQYHRQAPARNFRNEYPSRANRNRTDSEEAELERDDVPERYPPRPLSPSRRLNRGNNEKSSPRRVSSQSSSYQPPIRTSRRSAGRPAVRDSPIRSPHRAQSSSSKFSEKEYEHDDRISRRAPQPIRPVPNNSRGRSAALSAQSNSRYHVPSTREALDRQWSTDSVPERHSNQSSAFRVVESSSGRSENSSGRNAKSRRFSDEEDYSSDVEPSHQEPERRSRIPSSDENNVQFPGLSKTIVTKISKTVGVPSIAADVHETLKSLSGNFIYDVLSETSKVTDYISSTELEPVVEKHLGRQVEDLDQSFLNSNGFARWVRGLSDELQINLRNEAVLFLQQVLEFYLVELLANSREVAEQAGRSRVMVKDVMLASRLR